MASPGNSRITAQGAPATDLHGSSVVVVRTDWNPSVVDALEEGCMQVLRRHDISIRTLRVPGAVEIPFAVRHYWETVKYRDNRPNAFITLACVIRGDTPHFDHVCNIVSQGTLQLNLTLPIPTIFGVLTVLDEAQAWDRLGGPHGHKGEEAALTAISMIRLVRHVSDRPVTGSVDNPT
jgi:6,7-dimethyl-8-ribityllumazine synthase